MASSTLYIRLSTGHKFPVTISDPLTEVTVLTLKNLIAENQTDCPAERQRLIYKGRILDDTRTLSDYAIIDECTLHLVKGRAAPTPPATATSSVPSTLPSASSQPSSANDNANANPFGMNMASMGMMPPPGGMPSPEQMQQMMQSPMMQSLMDNPDLMRTLMESNPQMRQLMESNPQLREVMNDPQLLRQSLQMMRNPQAMQQMMRSQDLAMSQIENMPGGFAALSNMYRDVQQPMMEAMTNQNSSGSNQQQSDPANQGRGAQGAAMPNPWGAATQQPSPTTNATATPTANQMGMPWAIPTATTTPPAGPPNPWSQQAQPSPQQMEQTLQMLENPFVSQMMDQFLNDPQMMEQMMNANPMMQQLRQSNPQVAAMMNSPEMMRQMMNPTNLRAMMQLQNSMQQLQSNGFPAGMPPPMGGMPSPGGVGAPNPAGLDFSTLMNQFQSASINNNTAATQQQQQHPADRYRNQLRQLRDMGFDDEQNGLRALVSSQGNLNGAVDMLLTGAVPAFVAGVDDLPPQSPATAPVPSQQQPTQQEESTGTSEPKDDAEKKND